MKFIQSTLLNGHDLHADLIYYSCLQRLPSENEQASNGILQPEQKSIVNHHQQFLNHINSLPSSADLLQACKKYKTARDAYAFDLNGRLKGGLPINSYQSDLQLLQQAICAKLGRTLTVYRMASDYEFSASILQVLEGPFRYQGFMSTSDDASKLGSFMPKSGHPLLLEIECPPSIAFAPLDLFPGTEEGEYLLGGRTTFEVVDDPATVNDTNVNKYGLPFAPTGLTVLKLRVTKNPPYVKPLNLVTLTD